MVCWVWAPTGGVMGWWRPRDRLLPLKALFVLKDVHLQREASEDGSGPLIYRDIYFNIDNVVSSRPLFSFITSSSRPLRLILQMKGVLERVSVHLWWTQAQISTKRASHQGRAHRRLFLWVWLTSSGKLAQLFSRMAVKIRRCDFPFSPKWLGKSSVMMSWTERLSDHPEIIQEIPSDFPGWSQCCILFGSKGPKGRFHFHILWPHRFLSPVPVAVLSPRMTPWTMKGRKACFFCCPYSSHMKPRRSQI